jgi:hypothetical protein
MGSRAIVRETGFNWRTVAKWAGLGELPERNVMAAKPITPGNFQNHLSRRWAEGCTTGRDLLQRQISADKLAFMPGSAFVA